MVGYAAGVQLRERHGGTVELKHEEPMPRWLQGFM